MSRRVLITGLGPVTGLGAGIEPSWQNVMAGKPVIRRIQAFDPSGFDCQIASEVEGVKVTQHVPKSHRKAVKVMARDIELAVIAADLAARDAQLTTRGTATTADERPSYDPTRVGAHIGAGLIAADLNELTEALAQAANGSGQFDYHRWGEEGINHLSPLWLLKYLPNMLACHVTIVHDTQGPSNTITCGESSATLSIGESLRVIQRGAADLCFCGGVDSKLNPMAFMRQHFMGRLNASDNDRPESAVRPFCQTAGGTVVGEGGAIVILEARECFEKRQAELDTAAASGGQGPQAYAEILGFGASQCVNLAARNLLPDPQGKGVALAIRSALREASLDPSAIDLIIPFGAAIPECDASEAAAFRRVFGDQLASIPIVSVKALVGSCGAGGGGVDVCVGAATLMHGAIPPMVNCRQPLAGIAADHDSERAGPVNHVLVCSTGLGGQNAALVLGRPDGPRR